MKNISKTAPLNQSCPELIEFFRRGQDGVYYLSHASIVVLLNGKKFLFDPVLATPPHLGSWLFYPEMKIDSCLLDVDGVFISHQHQDHYDINFLKLLPRTTPIYIISGRPQFSKLLMEEGLLFTEILENTIYDLGDGVVCQGITHEYNGIDSAITISNSKLTVYHGNDCFVSNEKLQIVIDAFPKIDVACIPFAYVHWYPFLLDDVNDVWKTDEASRLIEKYLEFGLSQIEFLSPEIVIPFGANMFYFDDVQSEHNLAVVSPFDFKDYAIKRCFEKKDSIRPIFAGDYIVVSNNDISGNLEIFSKNLSREGLMLGLQEYIEFVRINGTGFDVSAIEQISLDELSDFNFIADRLLTKKLNSSHNIYITNSERIGLGFVEVGLNSGTVRKVSNINHEIPYHWFKLTDLAYKAYFSKRFTFNEIVASSRFRLARNPNIYDVEVLKIVNNIL